MRYYIALISGLIICNWLFCQTDVYDVVNDFINGNSSKSLSQLLFYQSCNNYLLDRSGNLIIRKEKFKNSNNRDSSKAARYLDSVFYEIDTTYMISQLKTFNKKVWSQDSLSVQIKLFKKDTRETGIEEHYLSYPVFSNSHRKYVFLYDSPLENTGRLYLLIKENNNWVIQFECTLWII